LLLVPEKEPSRFQAEWDSSLLVTLPTDADEQVIEADIRPPQAEQFINPTSSVSQHRY
jgi:hypothetical protein